MYIYIYTHVYIKGVKNPKKEPVSHEREHGC